MIDTKPEVGRYVFFRPTEAVPRDDFFVHHGRITKISGKRIVYVRHADGKEHFGYEVFRVCDTQEEVDTLLSLNAQFIEELTAVRKDYQQRLSDARYFSKKS